MEDPYHQKPSSCPICGQGTEFRFIENYRSDRTWSLYECRACKVQFWLPLVIPKGTTYEEDVAYQGKGEIFYKENIKGIVQGYWQVGRFLRDFSPRDAKGKKLLDVACGTGEFVFTAQEIGYSAGGVDFNKNAIHLAQERLGLKTLFIADVYEFLAGKKEEYDIITAFEIIEHVPNPGSFLKLIHGALKKDGILVLSTPNRDRYWGHIDLRSESWDFPYQHLLRWSGDSLVAYVEGVGFDKITLKEELPTDWFVERLRRIAGIFSPQQSNNDQRSVSERVRSGMGFSSYQGLRRLVVATCSVPSAIMARIFRFKGVHMYAVFQKNNNKNEQGALMAWLRSSARKPMVLWVNRWIGPFRVRSLAFKGYFGGIFSFHDFFVYFFKSAKRRTKGERVRFMRYLQGPATKAAIKKFVRLDGSVDFYGSLFFPCDENYWEMMALFDSTISQDPYHAKKFIKDDSVVMDIGANIGVFTVFAAALAPKGKLYAFEPISKTFATLTKNISKLRFGHAEAYRYALSD